MRDKPEDFGLFTDGDTAADNAANNTNASAEQNFTLREAMRSMIFWSLLFTTVMTGAWITALVIHQASIFAVMGFSVDVAVNRYALVSIVSASMTIIVGLLINRIRPGWLAAIQLSFLCAGLVLSIVMTARWLTILYALCIGVTMGIASVFGGVVWPNLFGRQHQGAIRGFVTMAGVAGTAIGPILFSQSFDTTGRYNMAVLISSLLVGIVLVANLFAPSPSKLPT
jgi:MFS family permease